MAPASAAMLFPAAAAALMVMAALQFSAAGAPAAIGLPGCNTTCGNVSVPYPFGYGPSRCYWPGLNLTCDTSQHPPRLLLLGDGSLRVAEISLSTETVRVMRTGHIIDDTTHNLTPTPGGGWDAAFGFGRGLREHGYLLSARNELVVFGCNVMATLSADIVGEETTKIVGGCASICTQSDRYHYFINEHVGVTDKVCTGTSGCCRAPLTSSSVPKGVQARSLLFSGKGNHTTMELSAIVSVVELGWNENGQQADEDGGEINGEVPLLLEFGVLRDLPPQPEPGIHQCTKEVHSMVCKSEHSFCRSMAQGYTCHCDPGYDGNPYLAAGCQDIDECKLPSENRACFGVCNNTIGSYECRCPHGTYGEPGVEGGCVDYNFNTDALSPTVVSPVSTTGMPNCSTSCGDVRVPYPFGFGHPGCYWPGFNLTCDTSHDPPRLLLGNNGALQVVAISLRNSTVRVIRHHGSTDSATDVDQKLAYDFIRPGALTTGRLVADVRLPDIGEPYALSTGNEFIVITGWDLRATLHGHGEHRSGSISNNNDTDSSVISRVVCSSSSGGGLDGANGDSGGPQVPRQSRGRRYCSGHDGCCHAPISAGSTPSRVEFQALNNNRTIYDHYGNWQWNLALAFISEAGLTDQWHMILDTNGSSYMSAPIALQWAVKRGLSQHVADNSGKCPGDVVSSICRSEHSHCRQENGGFTCHCSKGYDGNPYVADGCQDIDECMILELRSSCLGGYCNNFPGHYECRRVIRFSTGLIIGLSFASVTMLILVPSIFFLLRKFKQRRIKVLKQKYFKQNRGQLLQQLMFQKADIAEKMILPLDELAKATNNFDKARELGGGGHGTVYKGILSDLHVVAIKKSKIAVQKEINEFINEVAILSQINHKNVVKLFGCCLETEVPLLVYEFISNGTLYDHLHAEEPRSLSWVSRLRIASEIATSLAYLHSSVSIPIIHRDIKSSNILLDDTMTSKISDFGASKYITVDKTGLTTRVQGTIGYLDPMYFYTGRLTEKSDVYSFGVLLVELLTRKKPFSFLSAEGDGLVSHFVNLHSEEKLMQIIDSQVMEEGGTEVQEVATLAASCINLIGEERPTMRDVEHTLHGLQGPKRFNQDDIVPVELKTDSIMTEYSSPSKQGQRFENTSSRRYSLEQEMMISARYPR